MRIELYKSVCKVTVINKEIVFQNISEKMPYDPSAAAIYKNILLSPDPFSKCHKGLFKDSSKLSVEGGLF